MLKEFTIEKAQLFEGFKLYFADDIYVSFKFQTISDRLQERQDYWQC
jgi:hypothetical protein